MNLPEVKDLIAGALDNLETVRQQIVSGVEGADEVKEGTIGQLGESAEAVAILIQGGALLSEADGIAAQLQEKLEEAQTSLESVNG